MTIQDALKQGKEQIRKIYTEGEATTISEWVIEYLTGLKKSGQISQKEKKLSSEQELQLSIYLERLSNHEPLQYVLNESWFCGLKFYVDRNVLIPRPETEELVEWIITNCPPDPKETFPVDELNILDIGSGSGCIAVTLKRRLRNSTVWSCDVSGKALEVANRNANALGTEINFLELDFLDKEKRDGLPDFDIIVSNPPYVPEKDKEKMAANVLNFEPRLALFVPDNDSLVFYKAIADFGKKHLKPGGTIYVELHTDLGKAILDLFREHGYEAVLKKDMQGKDRMMKAMRSLWFMIFGFWFFKPEFTYFSTIV